MARRVIDMVGKTVGELTVELAGAERIAGEVAWHCRCSCGNTIKARGTDLRRGLIKSCGHLQQEWKDNYGKWAKEYWKGRKRDGRRGKPVEAKIGPLEGH